MIKILETYSRDTTQASIILPNGCSERIEPEKGAKPFRAQEYFFHEARRAAKAGEHERALTLEPHVPTE
ncbi:MAG: hypothetical protein ACSHX9_05675 [Luteolibacter sp.]